MNPLAIIFSFVFGIAVGAFGAYRFLIFALGNVRLSSCMTCEEQARLHVEVGAQNHCEIEDSHVHGTIDTRFSRGQVTVFLVTDEVLEMLKPFPEARFRSIVDAINAKKGPKGSKK